MNYDPLLPDHGMEPDEDLGISPDDPGYYLLEQIPLDPVPAEVVDAAKDVPRIADHLPECDLVNPSAWFRAWLYEVPGYVLHCTCPVPLPNSSDPR